MKHFKHMRKGLNYLCDDANNISGIVFEEKLQFFSVSFICNYRLNVPLDFFFL